jgi:hypothetical protein
LIERYGLDNLCNVCKAGPDWKDADCEKLRKRLSEWQRGRTLTESHKKAISLAGLKIGRKPSVDNLAKLRLAHRSDIFLGRHHTEESKLKMSLAAKKRKNPMLGRHHSEETKQKISVALKKKGP